METEGRAGASGGWGWGWGVMPSGDRVSVWGKTSPGTGLHNRVNVINATELDT